MPAPTPPPPTPDEPPGTDPDGAPGRAPDAAAVARWLAARGHPAERVEPLAGDVSARRYFRVGLAAGPAVVATYPPDMRPVCRRFLRTGALLARAGVPVPAVLEAECDLGFVLLEDAGRHCLHELPDTGWPRMEPYFEHAAELAQRIARLDLTGSEDLLPPLDGAVLRRELEQTRRAFLEPRGLLSDRGLAAAVATLFDRLCERLDERPARRPCHRDFMVRNLVARGPSPGLVVLDHQDLRPGPPLYDLASLLNDTVFPPAAAEGRLVDAALDGRPRAVYHRVAAQRCLKAVGTYAAFARRGDERHLPLVAPTLARAVAHLGDVPEAAGLTPRLAGAWKSALPGC